MDRKIFSRLAISLVRDPGQSLLVMALWLWLEEKRFPNIIVKMLGLGDILVYALADEAASCLQALESYRSPSIVPLDGGMPLTSAIMGRTISFQMIQQIKFTAIAEIKLFLNNVCAFIFTDILQVVLGSPPVAIAISSQPLVIPGFPHPIFGPLTIIPRPLNHYLPSGGAMWGWSRSMEVPVDDRTLFLTFSRGYPVTENEIRELFTSHFGDCVDYVELDGFTSIDQPLYARMAVRSVLIVDQILNGKHIAKFRINGKHIWARKYESRETRT
ncbi:Cytochrome c oxidase subunit 1-beta like [Actinidia chinensis var. chinensis]|uniref:Cytochrome c oxidase subunit 1-beta like n=1 Tax=Actinidia chinensis var. chinensis TaxID=1590841 RepID=A0A2R6QMK2_ACTCC|nr:Cytochrome c oxidase subunit 1-beta like [Actinidia chinensis var. chinensis]